jgi:hypothetical protein
MQNWLNPLKDSNWLNPLKDSNWLNPLKDKHGFEVDDDYYKDFIKDFNNIFEDKVGGGMKDATHLDLELLESNKKHFIQVMKKIIFINTLFHII